MAPSESPQDEGDKAMVTKKKTMEETKEKVKVGKLELNKETVKDLKSDETRQVKGGARPRQASANSCAPTCDGSYTCT
jgi:hypothetical protein